MRDLSSIRDQGLIIEKEKKKVRSKIHIPIKQKLDSYADLYEMFEKRIKETEFFFEKKRRSSRIELQNRIKKLNYVSD